MAFCLLLLISFIILSLKTYYDQSDVRFFRVIIMFEVNSLLQNVTSRVAYKCARVGQNIGKT